MIDRRYLHIRTKIIETKLSPASKRRLFSSSPLAISGRELPTLACHG